MKKIVSVFLAVIMLFGMLSIVSFSENTAYPNKTEDIRIRDPYILVHDGKYYMYGTGVVGRGYGCYISEDLENWSQPVCVFAPYEGFDGDGNYWAPECHYYNGYFYLFATYHSSVTGFRGVGIFKADSPTGPFVQIGDGHITPKTRDCIDGSLYIDSDGQPWMVYVNEWTTSEGEEGEMATAKLSSDLDELVSEPIVLFKAKSPLWTNGSVTDGPCMYRTSNGKLIMLWSNVCNDGYAVGIAYSDNGEIDGIWHQQSVPLYKNNAWREYEGGHAMIFTDLNGEEKIVMHSPNYSDENVHETATFFSFEDIGDTIILVEDVEGFEKTLYELNRWFLTVYYKILNEIKAYVSSIFA